jgi:hypothetical protein
LLTIYHSVIVLRALLFVFDLKCFSGGGFVFGFLLAARALGFIAPLHNHAMDGGKG